MTEPPGSPDIWTSSSMHTPSTIVIGTGIVGTATANYLAKNHEMTRLTLVDSDQPMAFTSAQSGENYRNWWPHPTMVALTNRSIDLMGEIAVASGNRINMTRRGYALTTRRTQIDDLVSQLHTGMAEDATPLLRFHERPSSESYVPFYSPDWTITPKGVGILRNKALIKATFPSYAHDIESVIHIRRGGDISAQQLGAFILDGLKTRGVERISVTSSTSMRATVSR